MKIFFIGSDIPYPGYTGGSVVNWSIVEYLSSQGHNITLFCDAPRDDWNEIDKDIKDKMYKNLNKINCNIVYLKNLRSKKKNFLKKLFSNKIENYLPECNYSDQIEKIILDKVNELQPDCFIVEGSAAVHHVRNIKIKKIAWSIYPATQLNNIRSKLVKKTLLNIIKIIINYFKVPIFQKTLINQFNKIDIKFTVSKDWSDLLKKEGLKDVKHIMPPFYDASKLIKKNTETKRSYYKIVILGLKSTVNLSQFEVLRKYVFPEIEKNTFQDNVQFHFIGINEADLPHDFKNKKYIVARGFIEDVLTEIRDSDLYFCVTVYPLGFRSRLCEALSLGACILTSKFDQVSIPFLKNNENCFIVDDIENTGVRLINILNDDANINNQIRKNARSSYVNYLSYDKAGKKFSELIQQNHI
jgi:glycosyltransferase involved in cell wall biosynthesis